MTYPVMLDGARFTALVVGGGAVAVRKTLGLLDAGVSVTVVAPEIDHELDGHATRGRKVILVRRAYEASDMADATIVIAATNDPIVNASVAAHGRARGALVNVVDDPAAGNFTSPAVHRSRELTIAVSTHRTPAAAVAIRDEIARRFNGRYDGVLAALGALRERLLGAGHRDEWKRASRELIGEDFCGEIDRGTIETRVKSWR